jgi:A/G-specific adenine glycosylase
MPSTGSSVSRSPRKPYSGTSELDFFAARLLAWFEAHGRHDLPWQLDATPYRVWISEIMLQQTQVRTVIPYYERFVARFPDVAGLAAAPLDAVLAHWSGLGYYARARNLHRAAGLVVETHGGALSKSHDELVRLPGIGRSTAAAILALSSGQRQAILDGNVKRVLARFHAIVGWPGNTAVAKELWQRADEHTPSSRVAEYTQAIMDLGATVCVRGQPECGRCPVVAGCAAHDAGIERELPTARARRERPARRVRVLVVQNAVGDTLLERRPAQGIWGGLLSFPEIGTDDDARDWCRRELGGRVAEATELAKVEHAFSHFDLTLEPVQLALEGGESAVMDGDRWVWYKSHEPLPGGIAAPIEKILRAATQSESLT